MPFLKSLTKAVVGVAVLPVDIVADVITIGGLTTDKPSPYTSQRAADIMQNLKDATAAEP